MLLYTDQNTFDFNKRNPMLLTLVSPRCGGSLEITLTLLLSKVSTYYRILKTEIKSIKIQKINYAFFLGGLVSLLLLLIPVGGFKK